MEKRVSTCDFLALWRGIVREMAGGMPPWVLLGVPHHACVTKCNAHLGYPREVGGYVA